MSIGSNKKAAWLLQIGIACVFLYAGIAAFIEPGAWIGYLPHMLRQTIPAGPLLAGFSLGEIALAIWLLSGKSVRYAAWISALVMAGIVVANIALLDVVFRDVAILFASLALGFLE